MDAARRRESRLEASRPRRGGSLLLLALATSSACRSNGEAEEPSLAAPATPSVLPAASATARSASTMPPPSSETQPRSAGSTTKEPSTAVSEAAPKADDFRGTAGIVAVERTGNAPTLLREVRTGRHQHYDRVVFEFAGTVPGYHLEYIDTPVRKCGSGKTTELAGDAWLEIRLAPANAHTAEGKPTISDRERTLALGVSRELELTCDFEAHVTWVLGVASPGRYRVLELQQPPRLVVDVHH